ncbi:hypothetical protein CAEBREN_20988 [Caenorhabditis brenneri]|uniref:PIPK domain-containing protein n=1 Tax=Caenorhabditis brenneri TaxID=135651 RepID=G0NIL4_CAEBE|nr:hypothetical protein CAEBREN_20988 [Caenorhabditis brenneri]
MDVHGVKEMLLVPGSIKEQIAGLLQEKPRRGFSRLEWNWLGDQDAIHYMTREAETKLSLSSRTTECHSTVPLTERFFLFRKLRELLIAEGEETFIRSLSNSTFWTPQGGTSGSFFYRTQDGRFVNGLLREKPNRNGACRRELCQGPLEPMNQAISNDSHFLSSQYIMDYSLLVDVYDDNGELILGIFDYMRVSCMDEYYSFFDPSKFIVVMVSKMKLRQLATTGGNPLLGVPFLQQLNAHNPRLVRTIQNNQQEFMDMLNGAARGK